jgi:hypothetical protein
VWLSVGAGGATLYPALGVQLPHQRSVNTAAQVQVSRLLRPIASCVSFPRNRIVNVVARRFGILAKHRRAVVGQRALFGWQIPVDGVVGTVYPATLANMVSVGVPSTAPCWFFALEHQRCFSTIHS